MDVAGLVRKAQETRTEAEKIQKLFSMFFSIASTITNTFITTEDQLNAAYESNKELKEALDYIITGKKVENNT